MRDLVGSIRPMAWVASVLLCAGVPSVSVAQAGGSDTSGDQQEDEGASKAAKAQKAFEQGVIHYQKGEYGRAIVEFKKGYNYVPNPKFLVNIGMSQMYLGRPERVQNTVSEVLESKGELGGTSASKAQALDRGSRVVLRARNLGVRMAEQDTEEDTKQERAGKDLGEETEASDRSDASSVEDGKGMQPTDTASTGNRGFGALGWVGVASTAVGVGGLVGAGLTSSSLDDDWSELERLREQPGAEDDFENVQQRIEQKQRQGRILLYAGAGLAAVGSGLLVRELFFDDTSRGSAPARAILTADGRVVFTLQW